MSVCIYNQTYHKKNEKKDYFNVDYHKNRLKYVFNKDTIKNQLSFMKPTKTELRKQLKSLIDMTDYIFSDYYVIINEDTNKMLSGDINYIFDNFDKLIGDTYTYIYENKQYTKSFSSDSLLKCVEIMNILNGMISIVNPFIKIISMKDMVNNLKQNINNDNNTYYFLNKSYDTIRDKCNLIHNWREIIYHYNNKKSYCSNNDYNEIFNRIVIV